MPSPLLNVVHLRLLDAADFLNKSETGGTGQLPRSITARRPGGKTRGRLPVMPPPVICAAPLIESGRTIARDLA